MAEQVLTLAKRTLTGKKVRNLRAEGKVPSVVYGEKDFAPILTESDYNATEKLVNQCGYHSPASLLVDGKEQLAMIKAVDIDPVSRRILNVEFRAITAGEQVEATAPIEVVGFEGSDAAKAHLNILIVMDEIEVRAKPSDLPKQIEADGSRLAKVGDRLTVGDLRLPAGVELVDKELDANTPVANVYDAAAEALAQEEKDKVAEEAEATEEATGEAESAPAEEATGEAEKSSEE